MYIAALSKQNTEELGWNSETCTVNSVDGKQLSSLIIVLKGNGYMIDIVISLASKLDCEG